MRGIFGCWIRILYWDGLCFGCYMGSFLQLLKKEAILLFHNPPEGDRREVVPLCEISDSEGST